MKAKDYRKKAREFLSGNWKIAILSAFFYTVIISLLGEISSISGDSILVKIITVSASLLFWIVMPVLSKGLREVYYRLRHGEDVKVFDFLKYGLRSFSRFWGFTGNTLLKLIWYIISIIVLFVILFISSGVTIFSGTIAIYSIESPISNIASVGSVGFIWLVAVLIIAIIILYIFAIIKNLYYVLTTYIGLDNHNLTTKETVNKSQELMKNNRGRYFCLFMSFFGWYILAFVLGGLIKRVLPDIFLITNLISIAGTIIINPYTNMATLAFYEDLVEKSKKIENKEEK